MRAAHGGEGVAQAAPYRGGDPRLNYVTDRAEDAGPNRAVSEPPANILILGTAEWNSAIATNQHYVTRELARTGNTYFVESLGLRRPKLRADDLLRMAARLRRAAGGATPAGRRPVPDRTSIVSPVLVPLHRASTRPLNQALLRRATRRWLRSQHPRVLWTFTPVTYDLEHDADVVVYHCVDLLGAFPGVDAKAVARGERRLATRATVAIATSSAVEDHLVAAGFTEIIRLPNVADVAMFANASRPARDRQPSVLFAGNLSPHKLDVDLLESIATALRGRGELLLAGPLAAGGGDFAPALRRLESHGARYLGLLSLDQLAEVAGRCAVGLIPYAINDYTRGVSPLKYFEYLASGAAVLSTRLPEVETLARANPAVVTGDAADLPAKLIDLLRPVTDDEIAGRIASATNHGWPARGQRLRELLTAELAPR